MCVCRTQILAKVRSWLEDGVEVGKTAKFTFKKADRDESGFIEKEEVEGLFAALIESTDLPGFLSPPTEAQAACYLQAADTNRDGKVSLKEWKVFMKDFITSRLVSLLAFIRDAGL